MIGKSQYFFLTAKKDKNSIKNSIRVDLYIGKVLKSIKKVTKDIIIKIISIIKLILYINILKLLLVFIYEKL